MGEAAFDTIAEVQRLRDVGLKQEQAEAITRSIHAGVTGGVATKADLERLEAGLRSEMAGLGSELRSEMAGLGSELRSEMADIRTDMEKLGSELRSEMAGLETGLRSEMAGLETGLRSEISVIRNDLRWIKLTGGAVLAVLVLPWLAEVARTAFGN